MSQFWPFEKWSFTLNGDDGPSWTDLKVPFALIGSHPRCHIQIDYNRLPPVVYFAATCGPKIEVWPLGEIAFPVWGRLKPDTRIMIGKTRLRLRGERLASLPVSMDSPAQDDQDSYDELMGDLESAAGSLVMDWETGERVRKLNRRISVLGEGHPSLMRMHGLGLRKCELGVVCVGTRIWAIQLNPDALDDDEPIIRELIPGGESLWVGNVHLWANEKGTYATKRFGILPEPVTQASVAHGSSAAQGSPAAQSSDSPIGLKAPEPDETETNAMTTSSGLSNEHHADVDATATQFTDQLLALSEKKAARASLFKWISAGLISLASLAVLALIILRGVLPIMREIYVD